MKNADVVVIGAGVVGALCAYELSRGGLDVVLLDGDGVGSGSSGHGHGVLSLVGTNFRDRAHLRLGIASSALYPQLADDLIADSGGIDPLYHELPGFALAVDDDEERLFRQFMRDNHDLLDMRWIDVEQCRAIEPRVSAQARGAVLYDFGQIDAYLTALAATQALERRGGRLIAQPATGLTRSGDTVTAVTYKGGEISCGAVVVAMGAQAHVAGDWLGWRVPVRPYYGEVLHVRMPDGPPKAFIMTATHGPILPRRDGIVMVGSIGGAAMHGRAMGSVAIDFDGSGDAEQYARRPTDDSRDLMISRAVEALPALEDAQLVAHLFGWRPMTPDQLPILGPVPGVSNAYLATGGGTKGIHLAPISMRIVVDHVRHGHTDVPDAAAVTPERFNRAPFN